MVGPPGSTPLQSSAVGPDLVGWTVSIENNFIDMDQAIFEAGDSFVSEPGHTPLVFAGSEYVAFTPTEEAKRQTEIMMPNIMRFAQEQGLNLPVQ